MLVLTATQQCDLSMTVVDAKGNPAKVDGVPAWSSSDEKYLTVEASPDGMSAMVLAVGPTTTTPVQVNVTADADLGAGVETITGLLVIAVVAAQAVGMEISAGQPVEQ